MNLLNFIGLLAVRVVDSMLYAIYMGFRGANFGLSRSGVITFPVAYGSGLIVSVHSNHCAVFQELLLYSPDATFF